MTASRLTLRAGTAERLTRHVAQQLANLFPEDGLDADVESLVSIVPRALDRIRPILSAVRNFEAGTFNHLNSLQYTSFLYLLANESWRAGAGGSLPERLFCLNRALNAVDLFYAVELPSVFFVSHGLSAVLGRASYGDRLVFFQNVTVGRVGDDSPVLGREVVLYPGAQVTGKSIIGDRCVISAGTHVHGLSIPDDSVVFNGAQGLVLKPRQKDYAGLYLRPENE
jgi:serine O-acetyltransferase